MGLADHVFLARKYLLDPLGVTLREKERERQTETEKFQIHLKINANQI